MSAMKLGSLAPPTYNFTGNSDALYDEQLPFVIAILLQKSTVLNTCRKLDHGYCNKSDCLQIIQEEILQNSSKLHICCSTLKLTL